MLLGELPRNNTATAHLARDIGFANELRDLLTPPLSVFVYARNQETVAATDGLDTFRSTFRDRARLSIVLHRQGWGMTPWTGVEEVAIKDRCLQTKYKSMVLATLDDATVPNWVPDTYIHFDLRVYSLQELAGVVKSRLQELGRDLRPMSVLDIARKKASDEAFRVETERYFNTPQGIEEADAYATEALKSFCGDVLKLRNDIADWLPDNGFSQSAAVARLCGASAQLLWQRRYANSLRESALRLRLFEGGMTIPGRQEMNVLGLIERGGEIFKLIRTPSLRLRWEPTSGRRETLSSEDVAHRAVLKLAEYAQELQGRGRS